MKIKKEFQIENLLNYGFVKTDKEEAKENEDYYLMASDYCFEIGHARRGQFYYLLVSDASRYIIVYATEPDGSGGSILLPDVLIKMALDGVFEPII